MGPQVGAVYILNGVMFVVREAYPNIRACWLVACDSLGEPTRPVEAFEASYEFVQRATKQFLPLVPAEPAPKEEAP